jgi:hypothetical protein
MSTETQADSGVAPAGSDSLTVTDNRTGQTYELPIEDGTCGRWTSARSRSPRTTSAS